MSSCFGSGGGGSVPTSAAYYSLELRLWVVKQQQRDKHFEGERDIPADKVKDLLTKGSREAVIEALKKLGWEGQLQ